MRETRQGLLAGAAVATFVVVATGLQFWRSDLDPVAMPLSAYLVGPGGGLLQAAYAALALGMVVLGLSLRRAMHPAARSAAPSLLFGLGAVGLCLTALAVSDTPASRFVHGLAAQTAFLATATALCLQAWRFRADPRWRRHWRIAFAWAAVAFVALWVHALWREAPRGLSQKAVIVMIVGWLQAFAWRLWRGVPA